MAEIYTRTSLNKNAIKSHKIGDGNFKHIKWKNISYVSLVK